MNIVEKVTLLRQVEIFEGTPGRVLAAVAEISEEIALPANSVFITEGEMGETLFVVVQGIVCADVAGRTVATLTTGAVVGEFAVFVPEPRSATVRSETECRLLSIKKNAIDELLLDYPEVAINILRAIVRQFQIRNRDTSSAVSNGGGVTEIRMREANGG